MCAPRRELVVNASLRDTSLPLVGPSAYLAKVIAVNDPDQRNRVQVRIYNCDGNTDEDGPIWARVATPFAGSNRGAFLFPDVDDEVLVVLVGGDPRFPVVVGGLWNGHDSAPTQFGGDGSRVDRWTFTGKAGTTIAIIEEQSGQPKIELSTPNGLTATLDDASNGSIELKDQNGTSVKIDQQGITLQAPTAKVVVTAASEVDVTAPQVNVSATLSMFSGTVQCDTLIATSVVSTSYTPGAGNVW
jgi:uncharacterized protein involved in type VI secretion and phage assembly